MLLFALFLLSPVYSTCSGKSKSDCCKGDGLGQKNLCQWVVEEDFQDSVTEKCQEYSTDLDGDNAWDVFAYHGCSWDFCEGAMGFKDKTLYMLGNGPDRNTCKAEDKEGNKYYVMKVEKHLLDRQNFQLRRLKMKKVSYMSLPLGSAKYQLREYKISPGGDGPARYDVWVMPVPAGKSIMQMHDDALTTPNEATAGNRCKALLKALAQLKELWAKAIVIPDLTSETIFYDESSGDVTFSAWQNVGFYRTQEALVKGIKESYQAFRRSGAKVLKCPDTKIGKITRLGNQIAFKSLKIDGPGMPTQDVFTTVKRGPHFKYKSTNPLPGQHHKELDKILGEKAPSMDYTSFVVEYQCRICYTMIRGGSAYDIPTMNNQCAWEQELDKCQAQYVNPSSQFSKQGLARAYGPPQAVEVGSALVESSSSSTYLHKLFAFLAGGFFFQLALVVWGRHKSQNAAAVHSARLLVEEEEA